MCFSDAHLLLHPSRFETDISLVWAEENPVLFVKAMTDFVKQIGEEYYPSIVTDRLGYITLVGVRKPNPVS